MELKPHADLQLISTHAFHNCTLCFGLDVQQSLLALHFRHFKQISYILLNLRDADVNVRWQAETRI